jgi:hypothetical protein
MLSFAIRRNSKSHWLAIGCSSAKVAPLAPNGLTLAFLRGLWLAYATSQRNQIPFVDVAL